MSQISVTFIIQIEINEVFAVAFVNHLSLSWCVHTSSLIATEPLLQ